MSQNYQHLETPLRIERDDGETFERLSIFHLDPDVPDAEVEAWVADSFPARHCQHSYDCCANYYPDKGVFWRVPYRARLVVHQTYRLNI